MARPKKKPEEKRERISATVTNGIPDRLKALQAATGLDPAFLVDRALLRVLPLFERDHGEILSKAELVSVDEESKGS